MTFAAFESETDVTISPVLDANSETSETVILQLTSSANYHLASQNTAAVTIYDRPTLTVTASSPNAYEQGDGFGQFRFQRTGSLDLALVVPFQLPGGNDRAVHDIHYVLDPPNATTSITIPANSDTFYLSVVPFEDTRPQDRPYVYLELTSPSPVTHTLGNPDDATVTIVNNPNVTPPSNLTFTITPVMNLSSYTSYAYGINDASTPYVVTMVTDQSTFAQYGYGWLSGSSYFLLYNGSLHPMGMAPGSSFISVGGANAGSSSYPYGFRQSGSGITYLNGLGGYQTFATDIGIGFLGVETICGYSAQSPSGYFRAVRWLGTSTTPQNLGTLAPNAPNRNSYALAVNSHGSSVGYSGIDNSTTATHAFRIGRDDFPLSAQFHDLGTMDSGSGSSKALGINDLEEVVGNSSITVGGVSETHAFYRFPGGAAANSGFIDLGVLSGGNQSSASCINNKGIIVGSSRTTTTGSGNVRAVLWFRDGTMKNLSASQPGVPGNISNLTTAWTLISATSINEKGYITGNGLYNGVNRAFILTPSTTY